MKSFARLAFMQQACAPINQQGIHMTLLFPASPTVTVPILGEAAQMPIHRIYCVGRNYEDHAKEMGFTGREPPFFFMKPADALVVVPEGTTGDMPYPSLTANLHHEIELVVAIGKAGKNIKAADAMQHIYGYAVGLDMTRRDLQIKMREQGRPWEIGKAFDYSAPIGMLHPKSETGEMNSAEISLTVNGEVKQKSDISHLIWSVNETIAKISTLFELHAGDLIFSGTPDGVGAVKPGDTMHGFIQGLSSISVKVTP
jgi:fumarylpyruvate hydrolase